MKFTDVNARAVTKNRVHALKTRCIRDQIHAPLLRKRNSTLPAHLARSSKSHIRSNSTGSVASGHQESIPSSDYWLSRNWYRLSRQVEPQFLCSGPSMCPSSSKRSGQLADVDGDSLDSTACCRASYPSNQISIPKSTSNQRTCATVFKISIELIQVVYQNRHKNSIKLREQLQAILTKIVFNVVVLWLTSDYLITLRCRLFRFCLCSGAWRFAVELHRLVCQLFQSYRIVALVINIAPAPFPFTTACQLHMHCQQRKLQDEIS